MAPEAAPPRKTFNPHSSDLIIALFLAKSRPNHISVQDYLSSLHFFIKVGRRADAPRDGNHHVDTSAFLRDALKKSEAAQTELRIKVFGLERMLEVRGDSITTAQETSSQRKQKRSANGPGHEPGANARKRLKVAESWTSCVGELPYPANGIAESSSHLDDAFLHRFYALEQMMQERNPEPIVLSNTLCQISSDIRQNIRSIKLPQSSQNFSSTTGRDNAASRTQQPKPARTQSNIDLNVSPKLTIMSRTFPRLLQCLHKLYQSPEGHLLPGNVIHSFVEIFRDLLAHICVLCAAQAQGKTLLTANKPSTCSVRRGLAPPPQSILKPIQLDKTILNLCNLLLALAFTLDFAVHSDRAILEGLLFFLLRRVGTALKIFVFDDDYPADFLGPTVPGSQVLASTSEHEEGRRYAEACAPYLIHLFERIIPFAKRDFDLSTFAPVAAFHPPSPPLTVTPCKPSSLHTIPIKTLQSTLLHAVFGTAHSSELPNTLSPSVSAGAEAGGSGLDLPAGYDEAASSGERGVGEWFKMEVWRILGWDILAGCVAW